MCFFFQEAVGIFIYFCFIFLSSLYEIRFHILLSIITSKIIDCLNIQFTFLFLSLFSISFCHACTVACGSVHTRAFHGCTRVPSYTLWLCVCIFNSTWANAREVRGGEKPPPPPPPLPSPRLSLCYSQAFLVTWPANKYIALTYLIKATMENLTRRLSMEAHVITRREIIANPIVCTVSRNGRIRLTDSFGATVKGGWWLWNL